MTSPNEAPSWILPLILIGFPIVFAALWTFVCFILSIAGGWARLADRFAASEPPTGQQFTWQTGRVGMSNYNSVLTIHTSPSGLHLAVMVLFRVGHKPLLIPWSEIHGASTWRMFFTEYVTFEIGSPKMAKVRLPKKIFAGQPVIIDGQRATAIPPPLP